MKRLILSVIALLSLGLTAVQAQGIQQLPFDTAVTKGVLPNGLTYYVQHNANPKDRAFFYIAQKVGSVQENDSQRGLAHFLEHMCFNGSEHFPGNGIISFCQRIGVRFGAHLNAYTSTDRTVYNIDNVPTADSKNLDSCLYILYDWANALTLDPKEIDKERGVIHEEWRLQSSGMMRILERQLPTLFPGSKYGNRLSIGLMSVVDNFKPQVLRDYYETWYRPDLQGIIVVGDIDTKQMEQKIKDVFGKIPAQPNAAKFEYFPIPDNDKPIVVFDKDKEITSPYVDIMFKYDPVDRSMSNSIVGLAQSYIESQISRMLNYRLQDLMQNADVPFASVEAGTGPCLITNEKKVFDIEYQPKSSKDKEAFESAIKEFMKVAKYGFTEPEYKRAVTDYESGLDQLVESHKTVKSGSLVQECVRNFLDNEAKPSFDSEIQMDRQFSKMIPLAAINQTVQSIIGNIDTNFVAVGLYPEKENVTVPTNEEMTDVLNKTKQQEVKPYEAKVVDTKLLDKEPKAGTIKKELPADALGYKTIILSNGINVKYKYTDFDKANISFSAVSLGGWAKQKLQDMDQVSIFDHVMAKNGLGHFNGNDLEKALTGRVVTILPTLGEHMEALNGSSSKKDFRTLFQLTHLYFTNINYDTVNFRNVYKEQEEALINRSANPINALQDSLTVYVRNNSPFVQPASLARLKNAKYDEVLRIYHERFANPADFTFVYTGIFDEDSLKAYAAQYLGSLKTTKQFEQVTQSPAVVWTGKKECRFGRKMETPQAYIVQLFNGKCELDPKTRVVVNALGDVLDMKYTETVREKYSFAYSVSSDGVCQKSGNKKQFILQIVAPIKPEKCDSALLIIDQGLQEIAEKGVNPDHLKKIKEQMLKTYEVNQRENRYWHGAERNLLIQGYNQKEGTKDAINALDSKQIQDFVNKVVFAQGNKLNIILEPAKN